MEEERERNGNDDKHEELVQARRRRKPSFRAHDETRNNKDRHGSILNLYGAVLVTPEVRKLCQHCIMTLS